MLPLSYDVSCLLFFLAKEPEGESPKFIQPLKSQEVFEGSAAKFEVRITGEPEPDVEWFKDEQPVEEGGNFRIEFDDTDGCVLVINSTRIEDEGVYRCVASNSFGKAISEAELLVTGKKLAVKRGLTKYKVAWKEYVVGSLMTGFFT